MRNASPRIAAIINPVAGGGRSTSGWRSLRETVRGVAEVDEYFSQYPGHAAEMARDLPRNGYAMALAVGGDGTIHEVVNGLMANNGNGRYAGPSFGAIPLGRGNDFARTYGLTLEPGSAWERQAKPNGEHRRIDIGVVTPFGGRPTYFVNMCGFGFDADAAATANRLPRQLGGALPYVLGVLGAFISMNNRALTVELEGLTPVNWFLQPQWAPIAPEGAECLELSDRFLLASVGIGRYLGGGMMLLPHADPSDGLLDIMLARRVRRIRLLKILRRVFAGGHLGEPEVAYYRARRIRVVGSPGTNIHADGDPVVGTGADISVLPGALPVCF